MRFQLDLSDSKLKSDLYMKLSKKVFVLTLKILFDMKRSTNEFIGRSAMVTKLLCIYTEGDPFFGV